MKRILDSPKTWPLITLNRKRRIHANIINAAEAWLLFQTKNMVWSLEGRGLISAYYSLVLSWAIQGCFFEQDSQLLLESTFPFKPLGLRDAPKEGWSVEIPSTPAADLWLPIGNSLTVVRFQVFSQKMADPGSKGFPMCRVLKDYYCIKVEQKRIFALHQMYKWTKLTFWLGYNAVEILYT